MLVELQTSLEIARIRSFKSNESLPLTNPQIFWRVQSGTMAIFVIQVENGKPTSRRRYLFSVKAGEVLVSSPGITTDQLLAVALEETELESMSMAAIADALIETPLATLSLLEHWIEQLSSTLPHNGNPQMLTPIAAHGILGAGEVFQSTQGTISWVQLWQGEAILLGNPSLALTSALGRVPLSGHLWFQAQTLIEVDRIHHQALRDPQQVLQGVMAMQTVILKGIAQLEQQGFQQEQDRVRERDRLDRRLIDETHTEFARLFQLEQHRQQRRHRELVTVPDRETALLVAAGAVGRSLGITICPPGTSEEPRRLKDPLEAIARASHIRMRRVTLRDRWWKNDQGALVAYTLEDYRPVALLPLSETCYEVIDPLQQTRQRCDQQIAATLAPTAYTFYRPLPVTLKPTDLLRFALRGHYKELIVILLAGIAATLVGMVTPQATAILIDQAIPNADQQILVQIGLGLFATALGAALFQLMQGFAIQRLETIADAVTQSAIWDRLLNLKVSFFRQYAIGDLSARVSAVSQIRQKLSSTLLKSLFSSIFALLNLGLLFFYSSPLALVATLVALINMAVTVVSSVLTLRKFRPLFNQQGKLLGTMVQLINGVTKFRIAGAESRAFAHWAKQYRQQLALMLSTQGIEDNLVVINQLLSALTPIMLFSVATMLLQQSQANNGSFSTGTFLAFNAAFGTFIGGATSLSTTVVDILQILPIWERAQPILQAVPEIDTSKVDPGKLSGRLAIEHVVFRYREEGALILDDVSLHVEAGEFIALVGPSGSGKSTLLRLLLGFDVPESGTVLFDGQDLAGLDLNAVRRQLGVVLQHSRLMAGSIFENIAGSALITMDEAWEAATMAGFAADVEAMPMGMHTIVSEGGSNLSGGQRQRLLIARALALRPRILLFDEATSALDNRTQQIVSKSLDRLKVTRIVVAHRLSTIRHADRIYVLQNGRLMQQGNFDELSQQSGLFRQLMQRQQV